MLFQRIKVKEKIFFFKLKMHHTLGVSGLKNVVLLEPEHISIGRGSSIGEGCIFKCFSTYLQNKYHARISIGKKTILMGNDTLLSAGNLSIGNNCLIAKDVFISNENHGHDLAGNVCFVDQPLLVADVLIGDNCWIGEKAIILPGVRLGDNCIVGAGAVVTKSFPDGCIIAGNPAIIIKKWNGNQWTKAQHSKK
jgi:Acetyltransferase (isoleucine patch superfamily)